MENTQNKQVDNTKVAETVATVKPTDTVTAPNNQNNRQRENVSRKLGSVAGAPVGLFSKPKSEASENPEAAARVVEFVKAYSAGAGRAHVDMDSVRVLTKNLFTAVRLLCTLRGDSLNRAFGKCVKEIGENKNNAFGKMYLCRFVSTIESSSERSNFVRLMTLMVAFATLEDKSQISENIDIEYSLELVKNEDTRRQLIGLFK